MAKKRTRSREQELEIRLRWEKRVRQRLQKRCEDIEQLVYYDELTYKANVLNLRGFMARLKSRLSETEARTLRGDTRQNVLLYIDLNDFKLINDTHGHLAGNDLLQAVAAVIHDQVRDSDVVGRIGGDEFVILAWVRDAADLEPLINRVRKSIHRVRLEYKGQYIAIKASIGGTIIQPGDSPERILDRADELMYEDKARQKKTQQNRLQP